MLYWIIFIILFYLTIKEVYLKRISRNSFHIVYLLLTLFLILRKGQGTDYYNYFSIFEGIKDSPSLFNALLITHGEIGFLFFNYIAIKIGLSFEIFMLIFSLITMRIYYPFFSKSCKKSIIPIFIFYSTFFLIYAFSAIRQGLAIAIILSYGYPFLLRNKSIKFVFIVFIAMLFHTASVICMIIPFFYKINIPKQIIAFSIFFFSIFGILRLNILSLFPFIDLAYEAENSNSNSFLALAIRIIALIPIFLISNQIYKRNKELIYIRNILVLGYLIYCIFAFNDNVSSRLNVFFRVYEGIFVFFLINKTNLKIISKQIAIYYTLICFITMASNIKGFIEQGKYQNCNIFSYPYFSIFDSNKVIKEYRTDFGAVSP